MSGVGSSSNLLELRGLTVRIDSGGRVVHPADGVDIRVAPSEKVGIVGESGSGKTITGKAILGLLPQDSAQIIGGEIRYRGNDITGWSEKQLRSLRGREIAMVFQDPMTFLNPTMTVGRQIAEGVKIHYSGSNVAMQVAESLRLVGLPATSSVTRRYPFELSGGMRQRVLMAIALACKPSLMVADEPTTALDVTVQAQILKTLGDFTDQLAMALLLITHDLGIVATLCDRAYVMYAGQVVEEADTLTLFNSPAHPYTRGLLDGVLSIDTFQETLRTIPGTVPDLARLRPGCRFRERCASAMEVCTQDPPVVRHRESGQTARCWMHAVQGADAGWLPVQIQSHPTAGIDGS
jgi:peptide/nickel transport system ATP-binding protein